MADLLEDIAAKPAGQGVYRFDLSDAWSFRTPSGGVLMSCALSAARAEIDDPDMLLRSATATFLEPVQAGALSARVDVLRRGRTATQARCQLGGDASAGLEVTATFGRDRDRGFDVLIAEPPDAVPVAEALDIAADGHRDNWHGRTRFFQNFDARLAIGTPFWRDDSGTGVARELGRWYRYKVPPRRGDHLDPLALPPIADTMPAALWQFRGTDERFYAPSLDLTVHFLEPPPDDWILVNSYVRWAGHGYATGQAELWSESGTLLAFATQTMLITRLA